MPLNIRAISFAVLSVSLWSAQAEFTIKDYCELTLKASEMAELEWKDRIGLAQSHAGSLQALQAKLRRLDSQYDRLRSQLHAHYGTTLHEYLRYGARHQSGIKLYLDQSPEVKSSLDQAERRVRSLRQQVDSLIRAKYVEGRK